MELTSIELIKQERERQINEKGYDAAHDDLEKYGALSLAGAIYACPISLRDNISPAWPWDIEYYKPDKSFSTQGRIKELVKAGALICAEIERLQRLKEE